MVSLGTSDPAASGLRSRPRPVIATVSRADRRRSQRRRRGCPSATRRRRPAVRSTRHPSDVGGADVERRHGQHPIDRRGVDGGCVVVLADPGPDRFAGQGRGACAQGGGVGRDRGPRAADEAAAPRSRSGRRTRTGTRSRSATSASSGRTSCRIRLRRWRGSSLLGSSHRVEAPAPAHGLGLVRRSAEQRTPATVGPSHPYRPDPPPAAGRAGSSRPGRQRCDRCRHRRGARR